MTPYFGESQSNKPLDPTAETAAGQRQRSAELAKP